MRCAHCEAEFTPKNVRGRFCSGKCRAAAWQRKREDRENRMRELVTVLAWEAGLRSEDFA
jgi:hypothetical protein